LSEPLATTRTAPLVCRAIFEEACVLATGEVVCSTRDPAGRRVYGNVYTERIDHILRSPAYRSMRWYQLSSRPSTYCPVVEAECGYRAYCPLPYYNTYGAAVKRLQIEPTSYCNVQCPICPATHFAHDLRNYRPNRRATLPLEVMVRVVDALPDLEELLFFNFGEPFLHPQAIEFLRIVRARRPHLKLHTSTNGIPLTEQDLVAIAAEQLLDRIVFSIDGSNPNTYQRYRCNGDWNRAIHNLARLVELCHKHDTKCDVLWQYILFEWNDTPAEIQRVQDIADSIGVSIWWVLTDTAGASRRYTLESQAYLDLVGGEDPYGSLTLALQAQDMVAHQGIKGEIYNAVLASDRKHIAAKSGSTVTLQLTVANRSHGSWISRCDRPFSLGIRLLDPQGRTLDKQEGHMLPSPLGPGDYVQMEQPFKAPQTSGDYLILCDIIQQPALWFGDRGSAPESIWLRVT